MCVSDLQECLDLVESLRKEVLTHPTDELDQAFEHSMRMLDLLAKQFSKAWKDVLDHG
jgi:hypothetical protein